MIERQTRSGTGFQYMLLLRGATSRLYVYTNAKRRFNTCSSCEEQHDRVCKFDFKACFNTCSSCEEQLSGSSRSMSAFPFQYMLLLRGATFPTTQMGIMTLSFNTCSSCEEQLRSRRRPFRQLRRFNTCSSCEEQPPARSGWTRCASMFQYMLLLRGATEARQPRIPLGRFNTCSSCEEQLFGRVGRGLMEVSIHAPLARSN